MCVCVCALLKQCLHSLARRGSSSCSQHTPTQPTQKSTNIHMQGTSSKYTKNGGDILLPLSPGRRHCFSPCLPLQTPQSITKYTQIKLPGFWAGLSLTTRPSSSGKC